MALVYLEDFVELIEHLPAEVKHSLSQIRSLDLRVQNTLDAVDKKKRKLFRNAPSMTEETRAKATKEIVAEYAKAQKINDSKGKLARDNVELMDRVLKHLDEKLIEFKTDLESATPNCTATLEERSLILDKEASPYSTPFTSGRTASGRQSSRATVTPKVQRSASRKRTAEAARSTGGTPAVKEEPVVEQYCICKQPSYGSMIACDNDTCPIEWFHYSCVGLTEEPKGKWYCHLCKA
eukprot:m.76364 g.76364  ORF g.76364 m.76364 type:complete len:237 (-) comp12485_c0_seq7:367-1077(-)